MSNHKHLALSRADGRTGIVDVLYEIPNILFEDTWIRSAVQLATILASIKILWSFLKKSSQIIIPLRYRRAIFNRTRKIKETFLLYILKSKILRDFFTKNLTIYLAHSIIRDSNANRSISISFIGISLLITVCFIEIVLFLHSPNYIELVNDIIASDTVATENKAYILFMLCIYILIWPVFIIVAFHATLARDNFQRRKTLANLCKQLRRSGFRGQHVMKEAKSRVTSEIKKRSKDIPHDFLAYTQTAENYPSTSTRSSE